MAHRTVWLLAVAAFTGILYPPLRSSTAVEVPFTLHQGHLIVTKGGIGPLTGLNLLIDTGTIPSVVDRRVAQKLGLETEPSMLVAFGQRIPMQAAVLDGLRVGPLAIGPVPSGVGDLSYLRGVRLDAIVGLDVLIRRNFAIDYQARVVSFSPEITPDVTVDLEVTWPFLTVLMTAATGEVRLLVDTGSADVVLFATPATAPFFGARLQEAKIVHYAAGPARLRRLDLRSVRLGAGVWDALPAWALDRSPDGYPPGIDGVLGLAALACQAVAFDFDRLELGCRR